MAPRIAIAPEPVVDWVERAVVAGGGQVAPVGEADALVWTAPTGGEELRDLLAGAPGVRWVQLPWAGVDEFAGLGMFGDGRRWTCAKGAYSEPVAEHALALALAGLRDLPERVRATSWGRQSGISLFGARVTILGGGGIAQTLVALLRPFRCDVTVVRRSGRPFAGAGRTLGVDRLAESLPGADVVILALALTPATDRIIGRAELELMEPHAWLVNVARGRHVATDDLVAALAERRIGGAALDVTDPEPLPEAHPLWTLPNVIITPHTANTQEMAAPLLATRIRENVQRFDAAEPLLGPVDGSAGY